ncbi:hypothetical protein [Chryseobacterium sp. StRB126]|nr:hypothetical protein [Chryseobacterium sp. StRB126]
MITPVVNLLKVKLEDWLVHSTAFTPVLIGLTITIENEEYRALSFKR